MQKKGTLDQATSFGEWDERHEAPYPGDMATGTRSPFRSRSRDQFDLENAGVVAILQLVGIAETASVWSTDTVRGVMA